jgi:hypothetical protein
MVLVYARWFVFSLALASRCLVLLFWSASHGERATTTQSLPSLFPLFRYPESQKKANSNKRMWIATSWTSAAAPHNQNGFKERTSNLYTSSISCLIFIMKNVWIFDKYLLKYYTASCTSASRFGYGTAASSSHPTDYTLSCLFMRKGLF